MKLLKDAIPLYGMTVDVQRPPFRFPVWSEDPRPGMIEYPPYTGIVRGAYLDGGLQLIIENAETGDLSTECLTSCAVRGSE